MGVRVENAQKLSLKSTEGCTKCCNHTDKDPVPKGLDNGIGGIQVKTTKLDLGWFEASVELDQEGRGFVLSADTGNTTHQIVYAVRFGVGRYPNCLPYNENDQPVPDFGPINIAPACEFAPPPPTGKH